MGEQPVGRHTDSVIYRPLVWGRITLSDQRRSVPGAPVFAVVVRGIGLADEASGAAKGQSHSGCARPAAIGARREWPGSRLRIFPDSGGVITQNRIAVWRV